MEPEIQPVEMASKENQPTASPFATPTGKSSKTSSESVASETHQDQPPDPQTRKLSIKGLADSLKGSIRRKLASSLQSILDVKPQKIFGMKLDDLLEKEKELGSRDGVPALVTRCIEYLIPAYVKEEGLFRLSGAATDIQKMKETINKGDALEMLADSPHNVAGLLKLFIRELPDPLIPEAVQNRYLILPDMDDREMQRSVLHDLISDLPLSHLRLMRVLFTMLGAVRAHSEENKMTASNLATCWAPNIFRSAATQGTPTSVDAAQKMIEFSRQSNAVVQFMIEEQEHLFKERDFERIYSIPQASPRGPVSAEETTTPVKNRKRSRDEMLAMANMAAASPRSPAANTRASARRAIRSEMIGSYDQVLEANSVGVPALAIGDILAEQAAADEVINSPAPKKRKTSTTHAASIFSSAVAAVKESPRAIGKMVSKRFSERRRTMGPAPTMCLMFYYDDSKHSHALKKLLTNASLTPCEIRDETRDPMTFAECKNLLSGIDSIVVVKKNGEKAYTETHPVSSKLDDAKLQSLVINPETGNVRAPTIIVGSTLVVGYDKDVEEFFSCYLFYK